MIFFVFCVLDGFSFLVWGDFVVCFGVIGLLILVFFWGDFLELFVECVCLGVIIECVLIGCCFDNRLVFLFLFFDVDLFWWLE